MTGEPSTRQPVPRGLVVASEWAWRSFVIGGMIAVLAFLASYLSLVLAPVIIALFAAALLEPARRRLLRWGLSRRWAAALTLATGVILLAGVVALAVSQVVVNYDELSDQVSDGTTRISDWVGLRSGGIQEAVDGFSENLRRNPTKFLSGTVSVVTTTGTLVAGAVLAFITSLFFVSDRKRIWGGLIRIAPADLRPRVDRAAKSAWEVLVSYMRVTLIEATFDATLIGGTAAIVGLPISFTLGVIVFLSAFIPTIGAIVSGLLVVLVALVTKGAGTALIVGIVVVVVQQFDANVLYPLLTSRRLAIHPLATLLLVGTGGVLGGLVGAFIAVPLVTMVMAVRRSLADEAPPQPGAEAPSSPPDPATP